MGGDVRSPRNLKVYVRYDATIDNTGGGGTTNGGPNNATVDPATTALVSSDTTDGPRYFIRESVDGDPNTAQTYDLGNGSLSHVDQRSIIDAGFLELTRMGELSARDPDVQASLRVVDSVLESQTASGPGWHRYGIKADGSPASAPSRTSSRATRRRPPHWRSPSSE